MTSPTDLLAEEQKTRLLVVAASSIEYGLRHRQPLPVEADSYPAELRVPRAVFVTLTIEDDLRGCVGTLESGSPLVSNVARFAYAAAFSDSRFPPLSKPEFPQLKIRISILSPLEPMAFQSEEDLVNQIRPGIDGLLLEEGLSRGTLLPSVWDDIPDPREFLRRLKMKAGLPPRHWSPDVKVHRYTATCFGGDTQVTQIEDGA